MPIKLSIVVPAYNEAKQIKQNLERLNKEVAKKISSYEIIFVDDGSTDNTLKEARKAAKNKKVKIFGYTPNRGKGAAIKFGAQRSKGKYIAFLDADLEILPENIFALLKKIGNADIAILSKNNPKSQINFPLYRRILSKTYYIFTKFLFRLPISDTQTGCKVFKHEVLKRTLPYVWTKQFAFDLELLAYANDYGYKIVELPLQLNFSREKGRIKIKNICHMFLDTLIIFFRYYVKKSHKIQKRGI